MTITVMAITLAFQSPNQLGNFLETMPFAIVGYAIGNFFGNRWINKIGRPDFDGGGTSQHELHSIGGVGNAAQADYGNFHRLGHLPYHTQGHWFHTSP